MSKKQRQDRSRVQYIASAGDVSQAGIARLLRSLHASPVGGIALRLKAHERSAILAAMEVACVDGMRTEVHVRGELREPTVPRFWEILETGEVTLRALEFAGAGIEGLLESEASEPTVRFRLIAAIDLPDLGLREWRKRWAAVLRTLPEGLACSIHDDERHAVVEGHVASILEARKALVALGTISELRAGDVYWQVPAADMNSLAARRMEKVVTEGCGEGDGDIQYLLVAEVAGSRLPELARLLQSRQPVCAIEFVFKGLDLAIDGADGAALGNLVISDDDVVWTPSGPAFTAALAAVQSHLESLVGRRLVVLDLPAKEFQRARAASETAIHAMRLLDGDASQCEECGGGLR